MEKKYLTVKQVTEVYGIHPPVIYQLINDGKLNKYKMNGTKLSVKELDAYAESVKEVRGEQ